MPGDSFVRVAYTCVSRVYKSVGRVRLAEQQAAAGGDAEQPRERHAATARHAAEATDTMPSLAEGGDGGTFQPIIGLATDGGDASVSGSDERERRSAWAGPSNRHAGSRDTAAVVGVPMLKLTSVEWLRGAGGGDLDHPRTRSTRRSSRSSQPSQRASQRSQARSAPTLPALSPVRYRCARSTPAALRCVG